LFTEDITNSEKQVKRQTAGILRRQRGIAQLTLLEYRA